MGFIRNNQGTGAPFSCESHIPENKSRAIRDFPIAGLTKIVLLGTPDRQTYGPQDRRTYKNTGCSAAALP